VEDGRLHSTDGIEVATGPPAVAATAASKRMLQLLEKHFGRGPVRADASLAGIDSLAVLSLLRALRAQTGDSQHEIVLRPAEVFQCSTVSELLEVVDSKMRDNKSQVSKVADSKANAGGGDLPKEYAAWFAPGQYGSTCKWLYGCRGVFDVSCFQTAAARLIARHEGLHSELCDGSRLGVDLCSFMRDLVAFQLVFWPIVLRRAASIQNPRMRMAATCIIKALQRACAWSLHGSWPKFAPVPITQQFLDDRVKVFRCRTWYDVEDNAQRFRDTFSPPFVMALFVVEHPHDDFDDVPRGSPDFPHEWGSQTSFVQFIVSHAFSDGYSGIPLVHDFSTLYARAWSKKHKQRLPPQHTDLTPLQHGGAFAALEDRFKAALQGQPKWSHPDQMSFRPTCFDINPKTWQPWVYTHDVLLEQGGVASLNRCAKAYGVPFDVALLSLVFTSMFRASSHENRETVLPLNVTLYAPMRDGDLNEAMVGLFSDFRDMTVPCSKHATVLGFCLNLADAIRHRRWTVFDPMSNSDRILVNILPLDEQARGGHGFRQTRAHEYRNRRNEAPRHERRAVRAHHRPMRITLEQESVEAWWMVFDINSYHYSSSWCRCFVNDLQRSLEDLSQRPLESVLSVDHE